MRRDVIKILLIVLDGLRALSLSSLVLESNKELSYP
jgi:hypothetical protein